MTSITQHRNYLYKALAIAFWLCVWQFASELIGKEILLVSPFAVIERLSYLVFEPDFWASLLSSCLRITAGFGLGFLSALICAALASHCQGFKILLEPLVAVIQSIPVASFIILVLIWVSPRNISIVIAFLMVFPPVYINILKGIASIPQGMRDMIDVFSVPRIRALRCVYLSHIDPYLQSATKISLGLCWKAGIAAEVIGVPAHSIGEHLYKAKLYLDTADVFAWTLVIVVLSVIFQKLLLYVLEHISSRLQEL